MAKSKNGRAKKLCYISVPSQIISSLSSSSLQSLLVSPKKSSKNCNYCYFNTRSFPSYRSPKLWFSTIFLFGLIGMLKLGFNLGPLVPFPCTTSQPHDSSSNGFLSKSELSVASLPDRKDEFFNGGGETQKVSGNGYSEKDDFDDDSGFWKQPESLGYRGCLDFSKGYRKGSEALGKERAKYLMVVVAGGMNQQRNQIVDAVVMARILGAALVVPILQVNVIWGDESEFSDIFDLDHFKKVLADDVRVVSSLPSTHIMTRPLEEKRTPLHASTNWIRTHYSRKLRRDGVLLLRGLDSRLSNELPPDLQKLKCKVAFQALRFAPPILGIGNKLAERMKIKGAYLALHLRMEKDVWVRTGCLPGLTREFDEIVSNERKRRPELLTGRSNMTYQERKLAGLCPLNALEVTRLLKALGAPKNARVYWAGGEPLGGKEALLPLTREFSHFYSKEDLALPGELEPFAARASLMAAIDYIVCEKSDVFMASHGGNMNHALQGQRAYAGQRKHITPNKRQMLPYLLNSSLPEEEFKRIIRVLHKDSLGQPQLRTSKTARDVTKYPVPDCMCNNSLQLQHTVTTT